MANDRWQAAGYQLSATGHQPSAIGHKLHAYVEDAAEGILLAAEWYNESERVNRSTEPFDPSTGLRAGSAQDRLTARHRLRNGD